MKQFNVKIVKDEGIKDVVLSQYIISAATVEEAQEWGTKQAIQERPKLNPNREPVYIEATEVLEEASAENEETSSN